GGKWLEICLNIILICFCHIYNVVGLGNPGMDGTRHNVGRAVLDCLAVRLGASGCWRGDRQLSSELIVCDLDGGRVILLKPKLLMNVNGAAVAKAVQKFGVRPEDVLLVHDELDKPLGKIAVKLGGSTRGKSWTRSWSRAWTCCSACSHHLGELQTHTSRLNRRNKLNKLKDKQRRNCNHRDKKTEQRRPLHRRDLTPGNCPPETVKSSSA
uniref:Uncharacterized protein n=1 Tax=Periophthalmus magnuspinnatus TaxID=409849 RepID=A0A3B3ZDJ9_9GOBI